MNKYILKKPLVHTYPKEWADEMNYGNTEIVEYANLAYFRHHLMSLEEQETSGFVEARNNLMTGKSAIEDGDYEIIKNRVKNNLLKRGLISENIYESYKYHTEGGIVDVSKIAEGDPNCCLVPNESYQNYFYELYISISYPYHVSDKTVTDNMAKILATVELLEQEHIYCKINLVVPNTGCNNGKGKKNSLTVIPLFSHRDVKSLKTMSSILNNDLLRKIFFTIWEDRYGSDLSSGKGLATDLSHTIKPVDLDECELASSILEQVIVPGTR